MRHPSFYLVLFLALLNITAIAQVERPNIIYIMLDEWGYYEWSGAGHPIFDTPNIDRLAQEGMSFTRMLAGGSVCAPTRSALMTGQHTGHTTVRSNNGTEPLREEDVTIAEILKNAGYATGGFGKWGLGDRGTSGVPEIHGFDLFYGYYHQVHAHTYYPNYLVRNSEKIPLEGNTGHAYKGETFSQNLVHEEAKKFIQEQAGKQPFFAYLPYTIPHAYYGIPEDDPAYLKYNSMDWDAPQHHRNRPDVAPPDEANRYAAFVEMADRQLGEILQLIEDLGIDENTLVILSGDNGANTSVFTSNKYPHGFFAPNVNPQTKVFFRGGKGNLYEGGLRVAYMARWPGHIQANQISDHLGYFPDVLPTLAEIAGGEVPGKIDGISFLPTLLGSGQQEDHAYLYWEYKDQLAVREESWKLVRPGPDAPYELYNLSTDISEQQNLAAEHPEIVKRLLNHAESAHSPDLTGTVYDASLGFKGHSAK